MMTSFKKFVGALFKDIQPLSNFDIIRICKKLKISNFKGCFMRDEISNLGVASDDSNNDECFIMNLDDSNSSGTHWVSVNIADASDTSGTSGTTYYFDSFGFPPTEEIKGYCKEPTISTIHLYFKNPTK